MQVNGMNGDRLRRGSMWALASGVAAIAAIVSYSHIYDLGRAHGGSGTAARLLPLSVDMLIVAGELMLLHEADAKGRRFVLGWVLVWSGIAATMAANVTYGAAYGPLGALIWGWPAYSFILAAAGMVAVVKRAARPGAVPRAAIAPEVAGSAFDAARVAYAASVRGGNPFSERGLADRFGIPRSAARQVRAGVAAASNGNHRSETGAWQ